jgi:hypothetical protein
VTSEQLHVVLILIQVFFVILLGSVLRRWWNRPLEHGPEYFLGIGVPTGYYEGAGRTWLRCYRIALLAAYLSLVLYLGLLIADWARFVNFVWFPIVLYAVPLGGVPFWVRRTLRPVPRAVTTLGVAFESRPLRESIAWRAEGAVALALGTLWALLLWRAPQEWPGAVILSWLAVGLLPLKIILARATFPLPPERIEEYHRWGEASRAAYLRIVGSWRWMCLAILAMGIVVRGFPAILTPHWSRVALLFGFLAAFLGELLWMGRLSGRVTEMGRALPPPGSWSGPSGPVRPSLPGGKIWFFSYLGGMALLAVLLQPWSD